MGRGQRSRRLDALQRAPGRRCRSRSSSRAARPGRSSTSPSGTTFPVPGGQSSRFLFATEDGQIRGWPGSGAGTGDRGAGASASGAIYKGLAIADTAAGPRLYATDFHNGRVDVFDGSWSLVNTARRFVDPTICPTGYAPFGIQAIGGTDLRHLREAGRRRRGRRRRPGARLRRRVRHGGQACSARVAQHGQLNAPWGLAMAPASFGRFSGDLLVGNFGDGQINAYAEQANGNFEHRGELAAVTAASRSRSTASGRSSSATAELRVRGRALLHRRPERRGRRPLRLDRSGLARTRGARPSPEPRGPGAFTQFLLFALD